MPEKHTELEWYNLGLELPSRHAAAKCYEELQGKLGGPTADISVWRMASVPPGTSENHPDALHRMVIITGDKNMLPKAVKIAAKHAANPWPIPEDVLQQCTARRLRVAMESIVEKGITQHVNQRAHHEGGVVIQPDGTVEPYKKRPQG